MQTLQDGETGLILYTEPANMLRQVKFFMQSMQTCLDRFFYIEHADMLSQVYSLTCHAGMLRYV